MLSFMASYLPHFEFTSNYYMVDRSTARNSKAADTTESGAMQPCGRERMVGSDGMVATTHAASYLRVRESKMRLDRFFIFISEQIQALFKNLQASSSNNGRELLIRAT